VHDNMWALGRPRLQDLCGYLRRMIQHLGVDSVHGSDLGTFDLRWSPRPELRHNLELPMM
jgi:hypothetical protein